MDEPTKYVCTVDDLDLLLDDDLKRQFQDLFSNNWRLRYVSAKECEKVYEERTGQKIIREPGESDEEWKQRRKRLLGPIMQELGNERILAFFEQFGINFEYPTVRDAVAFDLVKLDDESVSNDSTYTYGEHVGYSPMEYERYLLHKNFRINLVNLDPDWSKIKYVKEQNSTKRKRTVDKMYQGPRISKSLLEYFSRVMKNGGTKIVVDGQEQDMYVPFTNANDFSTEVALIPNTHPDFRQITSRSYYDAKWAQYKRTCAKCGFTRIATFALVDAKKDKNHTGEFLVKIQRALGGGEYKYLVVKMDVEGQIVSEPIVWNSNVNSVLCVCEDDFYRDQMVDSTREEGTWEPVEGDIPMVHSTTSSHYSIFRQRVPDYDLKLVRHYFQFKNRLAGMELCLEQVKRDVHHKEVRSAECFSKLTMVLKRLMDEFASNKELMALVTRYYDLHAEWDKLTMKKIQIIDIQDGKRDLLRRLQNEYNEYNDLTKYPTIGHNLDKKLALGQKIASLKLELDKSIVESLKSIQERLDEIEREINEINEQILALQEEYKKDWKIPEDDANRIKNEASDEKLGEIEGEMEQIVDEMHQEVDERPEPTEPIVVDMPPLESPISIEPQIDPTHESEVVEPEEEQEDSAPPALVALDTSRLHRLVLQSERWRNYSFNIGYELSQFKKMLTMCDDATIKVRRLVHNFEVRMEDTQEQIWDDNYQLRPDFDFKDISVAGLRDVILLHDWWAANAPGKTPEEMGMTDEEFKAFRRKCNKISYNLRKNQYAQLLKVRIDRTERRISELEDAINDRKTLHWDDKYGIEAQKDDGEKPWSIEEANAKARARIKLLAEATDIIDDSSEGRLVRTPTNSDVKRKRVSQFVDAVVEDDPSDKIVLPEKEGLGARRISNIANAELEEDPSEKMVLPKKDKKGISEFVGIELEEDPSDKMVLPKKDASGKRISDMVGVELEDEEVSAPSSPSRRQLAQRRVAKSVITGEATYKECLEMEKQYKDDAKNLVERTMNYLKYLGLVETEADIDRLALVNVSSRNPSASQRWLDEIQTKREQLDSSIGLMRTQRQSIQSILDNVAKMETEIQELKQKNNRIFDICMKAGKKVKGVDRQIRNRMLMDKIDNEQKIFELKQLVKKARSQHLDDFSSLEKIRKEVDEKQAAYDQKVSDFKKEIGLTKEAVESLMVGIYNKFQDEILEYDKKNRR